MTKPLFLKFSNRYDYYDFRCYVKRKSEYNFLKPHFEDMNKEIYFEFPDEKSRQVFRNGIIKNSSRWDVEIS